MKSKSYVSAATGAGLLAPSTGWCHIGFAANDLYLGMLHPFLHFVTVLPLIALALWFSRAQGDLKLQLSAYLGAAVLGAALGWLWADAPSLAPVLLPLGVLLGLLVAIDRDLSDRICVVLAAVVGGTEGLYNVAQVRSDLSDPLLYIAGLLIVMGLVPLHLTGMLYARRQLWLRTGARVVGSWIATASVLVLALSWAHTPTVNL